MCTCICKLYSKYFRPLAFRNKLMDNACYHCSNFELGYNIIFLSRNYFERNFHFFINWSSKPRMQINLTQRFCTITSRINVTSQRCQIARKLQLTAELCMKFDRSNKFDLCYYGQVNSLRLKSRVVLKWATKHLWG